MVDADKPSDFGTLSCVSLEATCKTDPSSSSPRHDWLHYEAKDLYHKWAVARSTITELRAKVESFAAVVKEKSRVIQVYERKTVSEESTTKKWTE